MIAFYNLVFGWIPSGIKLAILGLIGIGFIVGLIKFIKI